MTHAQLILPNFLADFSTLALTDLPKNISHVRRLIYLAHIDILTAEIQRVPVHANGATGSSGKLEPIAEPTSRLTKIVRAFSDGLPSTDQNGADGRNAYLAGDGREAGIIKVFDSVTELTWRHFREGLGRMAGLGM